MTTTPTPTVTASLVDEHPFLWLGTPHPLLLVDRAKPPVDLASDEEGAPLRLARRHATRETLIDWYRHRAHGRAIITASAFASRCSLRNPVVDVVDLGDEWADSRRGRARVHWAAFQLPEPVLDFLLLRQLLLVDRAERGTASPWCSVISEVMPDWQQRSLDLDQATGIWRGAVDPLLAPDPSITQPVEEPPTAKRLLQLARAGSLVDRAGRPLTAHPDCPSCADLHLSGEICPLSVLCPLSECGADARTWCMTPGGLRAAVLHPARCTLAHQLERQRAAAGDSYVPAPWLPPAQPDLFALDLP